MSAHENYPHLNPPPDPPAEDKPTIKIHWWTMGIAALVILVLAIGASMGKSDEDTPEPVAEVTTEAERTPRSLGSILDEFDLESGEDLDGFLSDLRHDAWLAHEVVPNPVLAEELARDVCTFLDDGLTVREVTFGLTNHWNFPDRPAGWFVGASVFHYCIEYVSDVEGY